MILKTMLAALVGGLAINAAWAEASEDWLNVAETSKIIWQGKKGSGSLRAVDGKKNSGYAYLYQIKNKQTQKFEYGQAVVLLDACKKGYGYVYYNNMEGQYTSRDEFVRFGPTVADNVGGMACTSWDADTGKASREDSSDAWELVAEAERTGNQHHLKNDTVRKRNYGGKPAVSALYRFNDVKGSRFNYTELVISLADCRRGFGTAYDLKFDGTVDGKYDVVSNGGSVMAALFQRLCEKT